MVALTSPLKKKNRKNVETNWDETTKLKVDLNFCSEKGVLDLELELGLEVVNV